MASTQSWIGAGSPLAASWSVVYYPSWSCPTRGHGSRCRRRVVDRASEHWAIHSSLAPDSTCGVGRCRELSRHIQLLSSSEACDSQDRGGKQTSPARSRGAIVIGVARLQRRRQLCASRFCADKGPVDALEEAGHVKTVPQGHIPNFWRGFKSD